MVSSTRARAPYAAVVFDLDGVITRTAGVHAAAWKDVFDEFLKRRAEASEDPYVPFDVEADYREHVDGKPRLEGVKDFLRARGIELPDGSPDDPPGDRTAWALGNRKNERFRCVLEERGADVDAAAIELVQELRRRRVRVGVASSSRNCHAILRRAGIEDLFEARVDGVVSAEAGLEGKPAPDIFVEAASRLGARPEETVVVEDAVAGVQAGRAGGFGLVVGIDRGGAAVELRIHGADLIFRHVPEDAADLMATWFERRGDRRPSALQRWSEISESLRGRRPALFLDYDGTLTPIVDRPEDALLPEARRDLLVRVARAVPTAIISGRGRDDVQALVDIEEIAFAGSHGFDIVGPKGRRLSHRAAEWIEPVIRRAAAGLKRDLDGIGGVIVENKRFSIAVHYRLAGKDDLPRIEAAVDRAVRVDRRLAKSGGKKVFEVRPDVDWDKGKALRYLLDALELDREGVCPIYIGDDVTDEDAFSEIRDDGIGIVVSRAPRPTSAIYWVQAPWEVYAVLARLVSAYEEGDR